MPISFSDSQLQIIQDAAAPLHPEDRARFLEAVANDLKQHLPIGDGTVSRVCRILQGSFADN
jgi:hypothetical protein